MISQILNQKVTSALFALEFQYHYLRNLCQSFKSAMIPFAVPH